MVHWYQVLVFLFLTAFCHGLFEWKNCGNSNNESSNILVRAHGCESGKDVVLSCKPGYKISILKVFFGHANGHKSTCHTSWIGQNCMSYTAPAKVRFLCQDKMTCTISPTSSVLGKTSCMFGLYADLIIDYICHKEHPEDSTLMQSFTLSPSTITLPGQINASMSMLVSRRLPGSTKLKLDVQSKVLGVWISIPCLFNLGSCTYNNFCDRLRGMMSNKCDRAMQNKGIPCDCPIPTGLFTFPTKSMVVTKEELEKLPILNSLHSGRYWVKAEFIDVYERTLGCMSLQFDVQINKKKRSLQIQVE